MTTGPTLARVMGVKYCTADAAEEIAMIMAAGGGTNCHRVIHGARVFSAIAPASLADLVHLCL